MSETMTAVLDTKLRELKAAIFRAMLVQAVAIAILVALCVR